MTWRIISLLLHPEEPALAGVSKDEASWFETREEALLTMRKNLTAKARR
jgi:hypothetical protein